MRLSFFWAQQRSPSTAMGNGPRDSLRGSSLEVAKCGRIIIVVVIIILIIFIIISIITIYVYIYIHFIFHNAVDGRNLVPS